MLYIEPKVNALPIIFSEVARDYCCHSETAIFHFEFSKSNSQAGMSVSIKGWEGG